MSHQTKDKTYELIDAVAVKNGTPPLFRGTLHDVKTFPASHHGQPTAKFPCLKKHPNVLPEEETGPPDPNKPRPKFNKWLKYFLGQIGHAVERLNCLQFHLDDYVLKNPATGKPKYHKKLQPKFEKGLRDFARFLQVDKPQTKDNPLVWPLSGLYRYDLRFKNLGKKKKGKAQFLLTLVFDIDDDSCMVTNCVVEVQVGSISGGRDTGGGGLGGYSSSSYLATSSSSP